MIYVRFKKKMDHLEDKVKEETQWESKDCENEPPEKWAAVKKKNCEKENISVMRKAPKNYFQR